MIFVNKSKGGSNMTNMTKSNPLVSWVRSRQLSLVSSESKPSLATWCSRKISNLSVNGKHEFSLEYGIKEVEVRIYVITMPLFVSLSVPQLAQSLVCHVTLMVLNNDWDSGLITDYLKEIACLALDIALQLIVCPIALFVPSIYCQDLCHSPKKRVTFNVDNIRDAQNKYSIDEVKMATIQYSHNKPEKPTFIKTLFRKDKNTCEYIFPEINNIDKFLKPHGTREVTLDFAKCKFDEKTMEKAFQNFKFERLIIENLKVIETGIDLLKKLELTSLNHLHTLVIKNCETLTQESADAFTATFPSIACLDLRDNKIAKDLNLDDFAKDHILLLSQKDIGNAQEKYDDLNEKLSKIMKNLEKGGLNLGEFCSSLPNQHCVAPFVTKVCFLKHSNISDGYLTLALPKISQLFPNMTAFYLDGCKNITFETISHLNKLKGLETLGLKKCSKNITAQRCEEEQESDYYLEDGEKKIYYKHKCDDFVKTIQDLYLSGVVNIRFDDLPDIKKIFTSKINPFVCRFNKEHKTRPVRLTYYSNDKGTVPFPSNKN